MRRRVVCPRSHPASPYLRRPLADFALARSVFPGGYPRTPGRPTPAGPVPAAAGPVPAARALATCDAPGGLATCGVMSWAGLAPQVLPPVSLPGTAGGTGLGRPASVARAGPGRIPNGPPKVCRTASGGAWPDGCPDPWRGAFLGEYYRLRLVIKNPVSLRAVAISGQQSTARSV